MQDNLRYMKTKPKNIALAFGLALGLLASTLAAQEKNPERNAYFGEVHIHSER